MARSGRPRLLCVAVVMALACAGAASCGSARPRASAGGVEIVSATPLIPARGPVEWVSYADHVVVVTVTAEHEVPDERVRARGEGMILREVTLALGETLWSRAGAESAPPGTQAYAAGWIVRKNRRTPFAAEGQSRLEVGSTYIVAMYRVAERVHAADDWTLFAVLPYEDRQIGRGEQSGGKPLADQVLALTAGQPAAALTALLAATPPDPVSTKYLSLDGAARFRATAAERGPGGGGRG